MVLFGIFPRCYRLTLLWLNSSFKVIVDLTDNHYISLYNGVNRQFKAKFKPLSTPCYNKKMSTPRKTIRNPHALTSKQKIVIADMIDDVVTGKGLNPAESHLKIYNTNKIKNARVMASQNLSRINFREALMEGLRKQKIIGANSKVETRLIQGLDAKAYTLKGKKITDYRARLDYIKEINKIQGVYAPETKNVRRLSLNINLDERIKELQKELKT